MPAKKESPERKYRILSNRLRAGEALVVRAQTEPVGPFEDNAARWCLNVEMWFASKAALERFLDAHQGATPGAK